MKEDEIRGLLREMREDPLPAASLARVRIEVERRTSAKRWFGSAWPALASAALACLVWMAMPPPVHHTEPVAREAVVPAEARPVAPKTVTVSAKADRSKPAPPVRPKRVAAPQANVLIRIETPDPDVVILLVGGEF